MNVEFASEQDQGSVGVRGPRSARRGDVLCHPHRDCARLLPRQGSFGWGPGRNRLLLRRQRRRPHCTNRGGGAAGAEADRPGVAAGRGPVAGAVFRVAAARPRRHRHAGVEHPRHGALGPECPHRRPASLCVSGRRGHRQGARVRERRLLPRRQDAGDARRGTRVVREVRIPGREDQGRATVAGGRRSAHGGGARSRRRRTCC